MSRTTPIHINIPRTILLDGTLMGYRAARSGKMGLQIALLQQMLIKDPGARIMMCHEGDDIMVQLRDKLALDIYKANSGWGNNTFVLRPQPEYTFWKNDLVTDWQPKKADWKVPAHKRKRTKACKPSPLLAGLVSKL
jgi:hypothetical protein